MTPEQKAFEEALRQRLAERTSLFSLTETGVLEQLRQARGRIIEILAAQPADWQRWQLTRLLEQVNTVLDSAAGQAANRLDTGLQMAWTQGQNMVDAPLTAAGLHPMAAPEVGAALGHLDATLLGQMRAFGKLRLKDVATEAASRIGGQLGLVTIGGQTPFEAIKAVQAILGTESDRRARTIVQTSVGQAFNSAQQLRMEQAATTVPGLQKMWRRSGKIHSRWNHDLADGQVVDANKPFTLASHHGPVKLMYPQDPSAPAEEVINCGCVALPFKKSWGVVSQGARPFSGLELKLDPRKAALDQAAKRAGLRPAAGPAEPS